MLLKIFIITMGNLIISEYNFRKGLNRLVEVNDVENDIADLTDRFEKLSLDFEDTKGRVGYIRQLTSEFLEYISTLTGELETQISVPKSSDMVSKMLNRKDRKRYYMSKFRL